MRVPWAAEISTRSKHSRSWLPVSSYTESGRLLIRGLDRPGDRIRTVSEMRRPRRSRASGERIELLSSDACSARSVAWQSLVISGSRWGPYYPGCLARAVLWSGTFAPMRRPSTGSAIARWTGDAGACTIRDLDRESALTIDLVTAGYASIRLVNSTAGIGN